MTPHEIEHDLQGDLAAWIADIIIAELECHLAKVAEFQQRYPE